MADTTLHPPKPPASPPPLPVRRAPAGDAKTAEQPQPIDADQSAKPPLLRSFTSSAATGFCVSLLCHVVLFAILAVWMFNVQIPLVPMLIDGANKTGVPLELDDLPEISLTNQGGKVEQVVTVPASKLLATPAEHPLQPAAPDFVPATPKTSNGNGNATGAGNDDAGKGSLPSGDVKVSKNVVKKGSFRVWAVPEKPLPRKPYYIYIEVTLPKNFKKRYLVRDLVGTIHGNESKYDRNSLDYVQTIPWDSRLARLGGPGYRHHTFRRDTRRKRWLWVNPKNRFSSLPAVDGKAVLMIKVPGAETERIKDTVKIRSKLLNEKQTLEIVF